MKTIALVGNPNSGKTTLFNALTGQRQFVGNWPGVTVQVKQGKLRGQPNTMLLDLPGIYSLTSLAPEEAVACDALVNHPPDVVLNIVDGTNLQRNLYLTLQLLALGVPVVVAVNCADVLRKRGDVFSVAALARELDCPVVEISALRGQGMDRLMEKMRADLHPPLQVQKSKSAADAYARIERITRRCMRPSGKPNLTERIDNLVLHKWLALPLFVLVMTAVYYLAAAGPGAWLGGQTEGAIAVLGQVLPNTWLGALLREGVLGGAGMLFGFVPQLMMVFLCLSVLEASGYLSRVAFLLDALLRKFGLSGKCFMPMLLATGCSVPAILATRAIDCPRERRVVAATCSFLPCSAKLPIIALMANRAFGGAWWLAPLMYFVCAVAMLGSAKFAAFFEKKAPAGCKSFRCALSESKQNFTLEMPQYRLPRGRDIWRSAWRRTIEFMKKAGSVIVLSGMFVWLLSAVMEPMGSAIAWIFLPLGFGFWQAAVATLTAFAAKENAVATLGVLGATTMFTPVQAMSFLLFNLLSMPCVAAVAALRRELGNAKHTLMALGWQCAVAYVVAGSVYWILGK